MKRSVSRESAFLLLFEASFSENPDREGILAASQEVGEVQTDEYALKLFYGVTDCLGELDAEIEKHSVKWNKNRLSRVVLTALRIAVYETEYLHLDSSVAINEAVELIKKYDTQKAASFANGILGSFVKEKA